MSAQQAEIDAAAQEYAEFLAKFEAKKTTDDCFTPPEVFAAVNRWAVEEYRLHGRRIVRPFHPGGDFVCFDYRPGDVVLDNPPFSILSKIRCYYDERGIDYFLFAPSLTLFSLRAPTMLVVAADVEYANGAKINTSFITSLQPGVRIRTAPALAQALTDARPPRRQRAQYSYPANVRNAALLQRVAAVDFSVGADECEFIDAMDSQRAEGKSVFGGGYLLADGVAAELRAAELRAAELRAAELTRAQDAIEWRLSVRELGIIKQLNDRALPRAQPAITLSLFKEASHG
ncbi:hypothetical protein [Acidovorax sp. MR-S7]|uniref:hypothetical protein n=1 Tax=Acidovorax sp. MR-S7 TaxID=1268622 RepID=UPI0003737B51|nr:hypothetical protein [Acidovorax sp. MR-S7]GAD20935.1 hypothetical protein AVS7_00696 [Acidovorax sp. MR-S7]